MNIAERILSQIQTQLQTFLIQGYNDVVAAVQPAITLLLIIFVALYGFALLRGMVEMPLRKAMSHLMLALFVYVLILTAGYGAAFFSTVFIDGPAYIAGVLVGAAGGPGGAASLNESIGTAIMKGYEAGTQIMANGGWTNWGPYLTGVFVMAVVILFAAYALFLVIMSQFAIVVLIILAPIFVPLILFERTRGIFEGWLRQVINFALIPILTYAVLALVLNMVVSYANDTAASGSLVSALPLVAAAVVGTLLEMQIMGVAGGIAGGMALGTMGAFGAALRGGGKGFTTPAKMRQRMDTRRKQKMRKWSYKDQKAQRRKGGS